MKATEQNFPVVLFIMSTVQGGPILLFVDDFLKCYHSDEGYRAELSCGIVCFAA